MKSTSNVSSSTWLSIYYVAGLMLSVLHAVLSWGMCVTSFLYGDSSLLANGGRSMVQVMVQVLFISVTVLSSESPMTAHSC